MPKCTCFQVEGNGPFYYCAEGCEKCPACTPPDKQLEIMRDNLKAEINRRNRRLELLKEIEALKQELKTLE